MSHLVEILTLKFTLKSNYSTKTYIKNISHVDSLNFALKSNLASLKTEVDKLVSVSDDLSKLSDVVKNYVVKKTVYDKLVAKVNSIDTCGYDAGYDEV